MNFLKEIAAKACIPLECGEAIREQLRKPITIYIPFIYEKKFNAQKWVEGLFSTEDLARNFGKSLT